MNYKNIYYKIIENAKKETENGDRQLGYFEKHHILPKSLGGSNDKNNLVKLTAREHFICHWLLVKMYDKGTTERYKMLCALWRMQSNPTNISLRYINARTYENLRLEYIQSLKDWHKQTNFQQGEKNSQYGSHWYTNRNTGESTKFKEKPKEEYWILGKNLFNGKELWSLATKHKISYNKKRITNEQYLKYKEQGLISKDGKISEHYISHDEWVYRKNLILNSGVDLTKFGWVKKVSKITGLNRTTINNVVLHFEDLKEKVYFKERIHTEDEWKDRLNKILNCGINLSDYCGAIKVSELLNIPKDMIYKTLNHFKK